MPRTYQLLASTVLTKARAVLLDDVAPYRNADAILLGWLNDAISVLVSLFPSLFSSSVTHTATSGHAQKIVTARAVELLDIVGVPKADFETLTLFSPGWQSSTEGTIQNWSRTEKDPLGFYCYPPSPVSQTIPVLLVVSPAPLVATTDVVPIPESYEPALVDFIASYAQLQDDEQSRFGRQRELMKQALGIAKPPEPTPAGA